MFHNLLIKKAFSYENNNDNVCWVFFGVDNATL